MTSNDRRSNTACKEPAMAKGSVQICSIVITQTLVRPERISGHDRRINTAGVRKVDGADKAFDAIQRPAE